MMRKINYRQHNLWIGLSGPPGSGKTLGSLYIAKNLAGEMGKVCFIDTENSVDVYAQLFDGANVINLTEFTPDKYIAGIAAAKEAKMQVLIIDSMTHLWHYLVSTVNSGSKTAMLDWNPVHMKLNKVTDAIRNCGMHVICCFRSKSDTVVDKDAAGKMRVTKVGLKTDFKPDYEYELGVVIDLTDRHQAYITKDRTGCLDSLQGFMLQSDEFAMALQGVLSNGIVPPTTRRIRELCLLLKLPETTADKSLAGKYIGEAPGTIIEKFCEHIRKNPEKFGEYGNQVLEVGDYIQSRGLKIDERKVIEILDNERGK